MFKTSREHNRNISKSDWRTIITFMSYKSNVTPPQPKELYKKMLQMWDG